MPDNKLFYHKDLIYTIYKEESFSKAARKLYISQPSLSVIVKKIEDEIGQPLFDRSCKPIRLTEVGEAYIKAATTIQNTEDGFLDYIGALDSLEAGTLRIGGNQLISSFVLPKYIAKFMKAYPKIKISMIDADSAGLENAITFGDVDIVVDNKKLDEELFENMEISRELLLLAVPASFPCNRGLSKYKLTFKDVVENGVKLSDTPPVPLDSFTDVPFSLITKGNDTRERTDALFKEMDFNPRVILEMDRFITQFNFLTTHSAATIVSDTLLRYVSGLADDEAEKIVFYNLPSKYAERKIVLSYKKAKHFSKAMDAFSKIIKDFD